VSVLQDIQNSKTLLEYFHGTKQQYFATRTLSFTTRQGSKKSKMMKPSKTLLAAALMAAACLAPADSFVPRTISNTQRATATALFSTTEKPPTTSAVPVETTVAAVPKVAQRWRKSTKQLSTLGPASSNREMIEKLFLAGADCFRLNFSHGSQEQKKELLMTIREIE
jgi:hypothetical protein